MTTQHEKKRKIKGEPAQYVIITLNLGCMQKKKIPLRREGERQLRDQNTKKIKGSVLKNSLD